MRRIALTFAVILCVLAVPPVALLQSREPVDLDAIYKIKDEGFHRSKIMETMSYLTDIYGPRLTNSPGMHAAADWAIKTLTEWGMANVKKEPWGPFGRGWRNNRISMHVVSPQRYPVIAFPVAWSVGTSGPVTAEAVLARITTEADFEKFRGQLKGKFVLTDPMREVPPQMEAPGRRYTEQELAERAEQPVPTASDRPAGRFAGQRGFRRRLLEFLVQEGAAGLIQPSPWNNGLVRIGGTERDPKAPNLPMVVIAIEHYGRIYRTLEKKMAVSIELDIQNEFFEQDLNSYNILAEIPGTDKAGEVVMLGAHFDSWHPGTGATDNAAGSAVMMEALRILKASGLRLRRTVRLALWTGEEQGLLGSREYVKANFADPADMKLKPGHAKLSGYFNIDNGTGRIRGIYLQRNEAIRPVFEAWMEPFRNLGMTTISPRDTGGTDHLAFDAVGLPGFQFIQDPMEYSTKTHHTNMDTYERIQEADMKQMAVIVASFVYHAANREGLLPREPLPPPTPQPRREE